MVAYDNLAPLTGLATPIRFWAILSDVLVKQALTEQSL